jgi:hypothetical protein
VQKVKRWDSIKPLGDNNFDLHSTVLIDDSPSKAAPGEAGNMLVVHKWAGRDGELLFFSFFFLSVTSLP